MASTAGELSPNSQVLHYLYMHALLGFLYIRFFSWGVKRLRVHEGLLRCGKSCRLRWINYLRPDLKRGGFTDAEEDRIMELHSQLGNRYDNLKNKTYPYIFISRRQTSFFI
jgi:hypothetical protein